MKRIILLGILSILGLGLCSAQDSFILRGQVYTRAGTPLGSGMANLIEKDSFRLVSYRSLDEQGIFELNIPDGIRPQAIWLSIEVLGFEQLVIPLDSLERSKLHRFYLDPIAYQLDEVLIEDMPAVRQSVDTIAFDPRAYADSTERTLEDILKKLPGVDVSKEGKISLGNQEIKSILLEGDDLSGSDYRAISQNLPIELVKRLEFVSNYVENALLAGFDVPESLVLNVLLHEEKSQKPSVNLTFGLGTAQNQELAFNSLAFLKKIKTVNIGRYQTVGDRLLPPLTRPWEALQDVLSDHPLINPQPVEMAYKQPEMGIPSGFIPIRFNSTAWGISRLHIKPSSRIKSFIEIGLDRDKANRFMEIDRTFFQGQRSFEIGESYELESRDQNLFVQIKNQIYTGKNSNLTTFSQITKEGNRSDSELALEANEFDVTFDQIKLRQDHKLAWIKRLSSKHILILDGSLSSSNSDQALLLKSTQPRRILPGNSTASVVQDLNLEIFHLNGNIRWIHKINPNLSLHSAARSVFQKEVFLNTRYKKQVLNTDIKLKYRNSKSIFALASVESGFLTLSLQDVVSASEPTEVPKPYLFTRILIGRKQLKHNWNVMYNFQQVLPGLDQVNRNLFWTSYRSLSQGDSVLRIGTSHNLQGRIAFNSDLSNLSRFTSYATARISLGTIPYQNIYTLDSAILIDKWGGGDSRVRQINLQTGVERYVSSLKTAFKLKPGFTYSAYNNQLEEDTRFLHSFNWNFRFSARSATSSPFDLMLGGNTSWNQVWIMGKFNDGRISSFSFSGYGDLMIHFSRDIEFVFRNEWIYISNRTQLSQSFSFQEFELEIPVFEKPNLKLDMDLLGRNLANQEYFGINAVTDYYAISRRIRLRPRTIMLRLRLGF